MPGSLTIVGTGIQLSVHMTPEARACLELAEEAFYLAEPATATWIARLNPRARSLHRLYRLGARRTEIYESIVEAILARVRAGARVCAAFPGHPGLFSYPTRELARRAAAEGFEARVLPGISAEDCLFADLALDPGLTGWQSYEATDFLLHRRRPDRSALLVLWQVGVVGEALYSQAPANAGFAVLVERLRALYPDDHDAILYEASPYPICEPVIQRVQLRHAGPMDVAPLATMVVPPAIVRSVDRKMLARLGLERPGALRSDDDRAVDGRPRALS